MSFLRYYMDFTSGSEVADSYHHWSGIFALSAIVNRRVWLNMGQYTLYPNLYVVLLGPPGNGKDLAMDTARVVIEDIGGVKFSGDAQTKESLVRYLRDECPTTIVMYGEVVTITPIVLFATELSHLLGPNSGHMIDFLTTIYTKDKRYITRTKNKGDDIIERPYVGLLAGTTPEWITTYLKSDIISGGFTRRAIFDNEPARPSIKDKTKRRPFIIVTPEQVQARKNVVAYGELLRDITGEFTWEPGARYEYERWYLTRDIPDDPDTQGYYVTKPNQVLKVAMLVSLSESTDLILRRTHWDVAMALLDKTEVTLSKVFQGIGRNELNAIANRALSYIDIMPVREYLLPNGTKASGKYIDKKRLEGLMFRDAPGNECLEILRFLTATDKIHTFSYTMPDKTVKVFVGLK